MKFSTEDVPNCKLLTFKRCRKPGNAKEVKRPRKCQRLITARHWWGKMYKPMNTGPFQGVQADVPGDFRTINTGPFQDVQADVPGDFRTFKLDACGCECVACYFVC